MASLLMNKAHQLAAFQISILKLSYHSGSAAFIDNCPLPHVYCSQLSVTSSLDN